MALIGTLLFIVAIIVLIAFGTISTYFLRGARNANQSASDADRTLTTSELENIIQARIDEAQRPLLDQIETLEAKLRDANDDPLPPRQRRVR
ncbi:MAG: hypothetical protein AAGJ10_11245 [Bacteroidota bacterium]